MGTRFPSPVDAADGSDRDVLLEQAVERACRAPSVHNTQPWRWRIGDGHVELFADRDRRLYETDPDRLDLLVSCGAALHHLRVALAGYGMASTTEVLADPEDVDLLATVRVVPGDPDPDDVELADAVDRRRTDRRAYRDAAVPPETLTELRTRARALGTTLHPVLGGDERARLDTVLAEAADVQCLRPGYMAELMTWTHRYAGAHDGVPDGSRPGGAGRDAADPMLRFTPGRLVGPGVTGPDAGALLVVTTAADDVPARLAAGEATSAVLLAATRAGFATAPLSQALELTDTRERVSRTVLHVPEHAQMIIRIGHPPDDRELPATPRRPLSAVLVPRW